MTSFLKPFAHAKAMACCAIFCASFSLTFSTYVSASDRAIDHAPIGVMADHTHDRGEWMLSYRVMQMQMQGSRDETNSISPEETVSSVANPFLGQPGQPATLRVVPTEMSMTMHMLGVMYAPLESLTLMAMLNVIDQEMDHLTFAGGMGTTDLGTFTTGSDGLGDARLSALARLGNWDNGGRLHSLFGVSIPTGDIEQTDQILTPMGSTPSPRLPYPMQLGSGTWDLLAGLTYVRDVDRMSYGGQWQSTFRLGSNEGYRLGNEHKITAWYARSFAETLSVSARLAYSNRRKIKGADPAIVAPVQTADPDNQGGDVLEVGIGANTVFAHRHRVGLELMLPVYRNLNGPQLETDWSLSVGYQLAF